MMKTSCFLVLTALVACGRPAAAGDRDAVRPVAEVPIQVPAPQGPLFAPQPASPPAPAPTPVNPAAPTPVPSRPAPVQAASQMAPSAAGPAIELYPYVRYKDLDEKHPRSILTVVSVPHPATRWKRRGFGPIPMVNVAICVPPHCGPPRVKYSGLFKEYEFDYGKYSVDVRLRDGRIEVDYQD